MNGNSISENEFLKKLTEITESNLTNAQFGVSELAREMGMSRSNLHRIVSSTANISVSQFISRVRLKRAMELLRQGSLKISEIAFDCGYQSVAYFTKCFREYYGYPPGEVEKSNIPEYNDLEINQKFLPDSESKPKIVKIYEGLLKNKNIKKLASSGIIFIGLAISFFFYQRISADSFHPKPGKSNTYNSIAVLPFENLNNDTEYKYYSIGIVEAINRHLTQISDLKVISLTTTDRYRESEKSVREIGKELSVSHLLEGSIQRHENLVRLEVKLTEVTSESTVWAENYDRELKDIFETQSAIAGQVVLALKSTLSPEDKKVLNQRSTENAEAYDLYLKGIYEYRTYTRSGNNRAMKYLQQAITLDSNFVLPYLGLAVTSFAKAAIFGAELSAPEAMALAKPYIDKALDMDPELADVHLWLGFYLLYNNWDFEGAEQAYKKSIVTEKADALAIYADFLNFTRRHEEAYEIAKKLDQKHPFYPNSRMILSLYYLGRYTEAEEFAQSRLRLFNNYYTLDSYGFLKLNTGHYDEAIQIFQQIFELENVRYPRILGWMGAAYARSGQTDMAMEHVGELEAILAESNAGSPAFFIAVIYAALGNEESALEFLQTALDDHEMEIPWLISEPQFYALHGNPAFHTLVKKVGFSWPVLYSDHSPDS
jgi:TolB-like protein/AraC-like DNA-binding protein